MFQDRYKKDKNSNQLNVMALDRIPMNKEAKVPMISTKPEEAVDLEKG